MKSLVDIQDALTALAAVATPGGTEGTKDAPRVRVLVPPAPSAEGYDVLVTVERTSVQALGDTMTRTPTQFRNQFIVILSASSQNVSAEFLWGLYEDVYSALQRADFVLNEAEFLTDVNASNPEHGIALSLDRLKT